MLQLFRNWSYSVKIQPPGSCFRCWEVGHEHRLCNGYKNMNSCNDIEVFNSISVALENNLVESAKFYRIDSLFDTR